MSPAGERAALPVAALVALALYFTAQRSFELVLSARNARRLLARGGREHGPARARTIGVQIASAIEAAHERGVIHRDLKPGNVMITPAGVAKGSTSSTRRPIRSGRRAPT